MYKYKKIFRNELNGIKSSGLIKEERAIKTPQGVEVRTNNQKIAYNMCSNNYLGLANHPNLIKAAKSALDKYGFGMASVRFI